MTTTHPADLADPADELMRSIEDYALLVAETYRHPAESEGARAIHRQVLCRRIAALAAAPVSEPGDQYSELIEFGRAMLAHCRIKIDQHKAASHPFNDKFGDHPETLMVARALEAEYRSLLSVIDEKSNRIAWDRGWRPTTSTPPAAPQGEPAYVKAILDSIPIHSARHDDALRTEREEGWNDAVDWIVDAFENATPPAAPQVQTSEPAPINDADAHLAALIDRLHTNDSEFALMAANMNPMERKSVRASLIAIAGKIESPSAHQTGDSNGER